MVDGDGDMDRGDTHPEVQIQRRQDDSDKKTIFWRRESLCVWRDTEALSKVICLNQLKTRTNWETNEKLCTCAP